ncbi:MAG: T9SS type B sorting domain-containing protein, partial [Panacibacter sp.]
RTVTRRSPVRRNAPDFGTISIVATTDISDQYFFDFENFITPSTLYSAEAGNNTFITGASAPLDQTSTESGDVMIMKLSERGTPLWSKNIGADLYNYSYEFAQDLQPTSDSGLVIGGATQRDQNKLYDGWISKMSADGNIEWSVVFDSRASRIFKVIQLTDGTYIAIGIYYSNFIYDMFYNITAVYNSQAYIVHLDKNGNKLWARSFFSKDLNNLYSVTQIQDGNLLVFGDTRVNEPSAPSIPYLAKVDVNTGKFIWVNGSRYPDQGSFAPQVKEMPDKRICVHNGGNISYYDENGNELNSFYFELKNSNLTNLFINYIGSSAPGEDYYYAFWSRSVYLLKVKNDTAIEWARSYAPSAIGSATELRDVKFMNNSFYLNVNVQSEKGLNLGQRDYAYFIKTDALGKTPCADTLGLPFAFSQYPSKGNYPLSFTDDGSPLKPLFRPMYAHTNAPGFTRDCYKSDCCTDTLLYRKVSVCEGSTYTLPNGTAVSANGIYQTAFKNFKGCDSIIYTTLSLQQPVKVSLGNDTCFKNQYPVVYRLKNNQPVQYKWQDGSADSIFTITQPGTYSVSVSTACNTARDTVVVFKECEFPLYVPSAFTPNNDGRNDVLRVLNLNNQHFISLNIFNRFGERIFFSTDAATGWDGTIAGILQQTGTYIYLVKYADVAGRYHEITGTVVLLR